jgi:two-component sensor histidine kinase
LRDANGDYGWSLGRALPMRDDSGNIVRWFGTCTDIHEQKLLLEQRQLVTQELSHRIKNIFSIVAGLISLSSRRNPEAAKPLADIRERIIALGRAHDFVRPHSAKSAPSDEPATLQSLLRELLAPYQTDSHDRVVISGADFSIDDQSTTPIALAFHELATNAAKYGGLSVESGQVALEIAEQEGHCVCRWTERSGPAIERVPEPRGFGTSLIDISITRQLGGRIDRAWDGEGLTATLSFPIKALQRKSAN